MHDRIKNYLDKQHMMQVATVRDGKPWSCTVYFIADDKLNLYWASLPTRRHSKDISDNPQISIAIAIQHQIGQKVIGLQADGLASVVEDQNKIQPIANKYATRFKRDSEWADDFSRLRTQHRLYKFSPTKYVLFDEQNFPDNPRKEFRV